MLRPAMKALIIPLLAAAPVLAQQAASPAGIPGCGDPAAKFDVTTNKAHPPMEGVAGKALVIVVQDDSTFNSAPKPTTRIGLDGDWIGANHGNSFLSFTVDAGVHHLCASWQPQAALGLAGITTLKRMSRRSAVTSFTAAAGSVYYFRVKDVFFTTETNEVIEIKLDAVDSDEGQLLANDRPVSVFKRK